MSSNPDSSHRRKKRRLISPDNGVLSSSDLHDSPSSSTSPQHDFVPPPAPSDVRSVPLRHPAQLQAARRHNAHSPTSHESPPAHVEDRSFHHHGDSYYNSHNVHGTANYIENVTNATLGSNSVTTIERAFFSSGSEATVLWDSLPKQRDMSGQRNEYLEGSREETVQYALRWGKDSGSEPSLLIHGAAGLGKSTLAHHLTHRLHAAGCLAASVSLNALPSDSRGPESVVKLVSREIGETHPGAIPSILEAIKLGGCMEYIRGWDEARRRTEDRARAVVWSTPLDQTTRF